MERTPAGSVWYFIIGAGFIGFWLYMALLGPSDEGWVLWGMLGLAIAAAFYAGRLTQDIVRIGVWIVTGLFIGFLAAAAILEGDPMIIATFITGAGAGLIAAGLPPYNEPLAGDLQRPGTAYAPPPNDPAPPRAGEPQRPYQRQWSTVGQQQQQQDPGYGPEYR